jgi:hypothetical protein
LMHEMVAIEIAGLSEWLRVDVVHLTLRRQVWRCWS